MSIQRTITIGLLAAGTAANFWINPQGKEPKIDKNSKADKVSKISETLGSQLDASYFIIHGAKKGFKWIGKGIKQFKFALESGVFTSSLSTWVRSPQAIQTFILASGSLWLTYSNHKAFKPNVSVLNKAGSLVSSWLGESKKIVEAHQLMMTLTTLYQNPNSYLRPVAFAATMIVTSHLVSRYTNKT